MDYSEDEDSLEEAPPPLLSSLTIKEDEDEDEDKEKGEGKGEEKGEGKGEGKMKRCNCMESYEDKRDDDNLVTICLLSYDINRLNV